METKMEGLGTIINKLIKKEILIPDFQRNFVWKEPERQRMIVASVLAKMPVGSILLLKGDAKEYAYKLVGCNDRKTAEELGVSGDTLALLDGQQRITVLSNAFSSTIFQMAGTPSKLIRRPALQRRFFLRLPKYEHQENEIKDFFHIRELVFPLSDPNNDEPDYLSDDIFDAIKIVQFNKGDDVCYNPFLKVAKSKMDLIDYCTSEKENLIPLFLLTDLESQTENGVWLGQILNRMTENIIINILNEFDANPESEREEFVKSKLSRQYLEFIKAGKITDREVFEKNLKQQGEDWASSCKNFLKSCLDKIQLNQIIVDNNKRARAINIYENLNKGGVSLGTFELIMAKVASVSSDNYYQKLVKNMKEARKYPEMIFSAQLKSSLTIREYVNSDNYTATIKLQCLIRDEDEISKNYIDAYLDVITLLYNVPDFDADKLRVDCIKKDKILSVDAHYLNDKCEAVCEAIDLALFFFQMRCGIRNIKDINYNLMLVAVAYILLNDDYRNNARTYDYLEAWYWTVVFSGYLNTDQNDRCIKSIQKLIHIIETNDCGWLRELEEKVLAESNFSEKQFLLMNRVEDNGISPKEFLRDVICQFYLAKTYKGLFDEELKLNPFTEKGLQRHHVIPLGSRFNLKTEKVKNAIDVIRRDREHFLNSPVNFIYVSSEENSMISDRLLIEYQKMITSDYSKGLLGFIGDMSTSSDEECKKVLSNRFDHLRAEVTGHIDMLLPD